MATTHEERYAQAEAIASAARSIAEVLRYNVPGTVESAEAVIEEIKDGYRTCRAHFPEEQEVPEEVMNHIKVFTQQIFGN